MAGVAQSPTGSPSASAREGQLLTLLALAGALNISRFAELAAAAGIRESAARQLSTTALRVLLEPLVERGLVLHEDGTFQCANGVRDAAVRRAAAAGTLAGLVAPVRERLAQPFFSALGGGRSALPLFDLRVALAGIGPTADACLTTALQSSKSSRVALDVVLPALAMPFDASWFERISNDLQRRLLALSLPIAEALALGVDELYRYLAIHLERWSESPAALSALGGLAIVKGDLALAQRIAGLSGGGDAARAVAASLALIEERRDEALALFASTSKRRAGHAGVSGLLHVLALLRRGGPADLRLARALATAGARKDDPLREAHGWLKAIAECSEDPRLTTRAEHAARRGEEAPDCFAPLLRALFASWFEVSELERKAAAQDAAEICAPLVEHGHAWLAEQYGQAASALALKLNDADLRGKIERLVPASPRFGTPLHAYRAQKEPWECGVEQLEGLAASANPESPPRDERSERLIWRVAPYHFTIEPYLQVRTASGWTKGRKLAIKHLVHGGDLLRQLGEEDAKVAAFARERREIYSGYPQISYVMARGALTALVGHPRVYFDDADTPCEVARGVVQVIARSEGDQLAVTIDPQLSGVELEVRVDSGRLLVFEPPESVRALAMVIGSGLSVPPEGRTRALEALGGLAHVVSVQTSEQTSARKVPPDPTPHVRLVPRGAGLSLTLVVRPLGESGPCVTPGLGASTLLGRAHDQAVQTERDLAAEARRAREVLRAAGLPEEDALDATWIFEDAEACLALLSALRALEPAARVEWPKGAPLRLRARVGKKALRGRLRHGADFFLATASLVVDEGLSIELEELLALLAQRPGKFVRLESGEYLELEQELRELLTSIAAARAESRGKQRGVPISRSALPALERLTEDDSGFTLDQGSAAWRERLLAATERRYAVPRALEAELRPYQVEGFEWLSRLAELELGACLADDMGLGKTVQIIALLVQRARLGPALVVAPTSVCENWRRELSRFAPTLRTCLYAGPGREQALAELRAGHVVITSYALLQQDAAPLQAIAWSSAVLDEAQLIKNAESQRARAAFGLRAAFRVAATGTPVENHAGDLFSIFRFLMPELLGRWPAFSRRFGGALSGEAGAEARRALRRLIQPFILRRTKGQVLSDLPPRTEIQHSVALSGEEVRLYEGVRRAALAQLAVGAEDPRMRVRVLAEITRLRRLCCHPGLAVDDAVTGSSKLESFLALVGDLREGRHRALVFSQFVDMLGLVRKAIEERGISYQYLDGSTPAKQRARAVDAFQAGEGELFLISLRAGGFGLNLTAADYVIHLDPWWNPAVESQASDRAHRLGQTRPVTVYRMVAAGTIEERIVELHHRKRDLADALLDDTHRAATLSTQELKALLDESSLSPG
jgi:superfamily II DNA or RNA helicase